MQDTKNRGKSPKTIRLLVAATVVSVVVLLGAFAAAANGSTVGFGFDSRDISGFTNAGHVALTGGGAFNLDTAAGAVHAGGGFSCTTDVGTGFLAGCLQSEGVRWDAAALLASTTFKCTGSIGEAAKTATTGADTAVLQGDFYRAGDANDSSFASPAR